LNSSLLGEEELNTLPEGPHLFLVVKDGQLQEEIIALNGYR